MELDQINCPTNQGEFCSGSERGICLESKMCQCSDNFRGPACEYACPMGANQSPCSGRGKCHIPDPIDGSPRPVCTCSSGYLGVACEIDEVPTASIQMDPVTASVTTTAPGMPVYQGFLMSGTPTSLSLVLAAKKSQALAIEPTSFTFHIQDADHDKPVVLSGQTVTYTFVPGPATISAKITWPLNPDVTTATVNVMVNDCLCSGKGECNTQGKCVCEATASGDFCQDELVSGVAVIGASAPDTPHKYVYIPFTRSLGDTLKQIAFKPYQLPSGMTFSFQVISSTYKGVYIKVVRSDSAAPWTHRLRVVYNVRGLRFIEPQAGSVAVGPSGPTSPKTFLIRYPVPYNEAPFLSMTAIGTNPALPDKFKFVVRRIGAHSALVSVQRHDPGVSTFALWTQSFTAQWNTRAFPSGRDIIQFGTKFIGPKPAGPAEFFIAFEELYRNIPQIKFTLAKAHSDEVFDAILLKTTQAGITFRVVRLSDDGNIKHGWKSQIELDWKSYPDSYDLASLPTVAEFPEHDFIGFDAVDPVQMSDIATAEDCAQLCLQNPECKSYTFSASSPACASVVAPGLCSLKGVPVSAYPLNLVKNTCVNTMEITSTAQRFRKGRVFPVMHTQPQWTRSMCMDQSILVGAAVKTTTGGVKSDVSCMYVILRHVSHNVSFMQVFLLR
jgi:hypothetical protein